MQRLPKVKLSRILIALLIALVLVGAAHFIPTPYLLRAPGRASDVNSMITIKGARTYPVRGKLFMTTVIYDRATVLYCLYALTDPYAELIPLPTSRGSAKADSLGGWEMKQSKFLAKVDALRYLGYTIKASPSGAQVVRILPSSPAQGVLEPGDVVVDAGGHRVKTVTDLVRAVSSTARGHTVALSYLRHGERAEATIPTYRHDGRTMLGVQIRTQFGQPHLPLNISIDVGNVSGASAGLAFALGIINRLTPQDLTRGRRIALTGTLDGWDRVGVVSGADLKAVAAKRAGATLFLCPRANVSEARSSGTGLKVIGVDTLQQALQVLRSQDSSRS